MISLEKSSGLPLAMKEDFSLVFDAGMRRAAPEIREFSALKNFLKDPIGQYHRRDVYHVYRDVCLTKDFEAIQSAGLQYDLTVIPPGKIGSEFVKTEGHYHSYKAGTQIRYPEVYEVLSGRVFWLLQSASADLERLESAYLISAQRGEKIIVPPGFGHVSINPVDEVLVLANWQVRGVGGIYEPFEKYNGGAYYIMQSERLTKTGETAPDFEFMPNLHYNAVPPLKKVYPRELPQYDLLFALSLYFTGVRNFASLEFLTLPERYLTDLTPDRLFIS